MYIHAFEVRHVMSDGLVWLIDRMCMCAAADRGRYGGARNKILHVINAALATVNLKYTLPAFPSQPIDRRMLQLLSNLPTDAIPDVQPIPTS